MRPTENVCQRTLSSSSITTHSLGSADTLPDIPCSTPVDNARNSREVMNIFNQIISGGIEEGNEEENTQDDISSGEIILRTVDPLEEDSQMTIIEESLSGTNTSAQSRSHQQPESTMSTPIPEIENAANIANNPIEAAPETDALQEMVGIARNFRDEQNKVIEMFGNFLKDRIRIEEQKIEIERERNEIFRAGFENLSKCVESISNLFSASSSPNPQFQE
ncbi:uncharacterized protein LOC128664417 [Bombina bombina]|nr:uncharacterized protein LOC128636227 [Bombina bombina]XP_053555709.1 uncharacterized protein LOC128646924 [Bombina bombina]XP_053561282.1 uncharacterized protein LOC128652368 [Bombina bombina]XP_053569000.1 uncharacterized protein LOC128659367 [Bombina bombina]XP_053571331.1 uncharacterized protein LOC128661151 [Bombina bombina]XP_053571631.1 uncharacterized protein LOC128661396 [Bombina bombina]XP_053575223.1 uncharacterized protein LOC128664417 [Bombina bombina]